MFNLHPYQRDIIRDTRLALREHNSVLIQAPTGSGKTVLSAEMLGKASYKGKRSFFICHRAELIEQSSKTFEKVGIPHGFIANGYAPDPWQPVQICSIDTLKNRYNKIQPPDLCIWDESHHLAAAGWAKVHGAYDKAKHVGLTATPERLDGKGLGDWFSHMIKGPSVSWLIESGFLADYKAFAPSIPDLTGVHKRMGDYKHDELEQVMDNNVISGNAISHYLDLVPGKPAVAFCVSIKHSEHVAERFRQAGVMAVHIDGKMNKHDRKIAIDSFRKGDIKVLCNVDIVGEGFDLPSLTASILLRPTQSLALYLQQVGRALRTDTGKDNAYILDHAGNIMKHGLPDEEREWSLDSKKRTGKKKDSEREEPIKVCEKCFGVHAPSPQCPYCGHVYEVKGREIEETDAKLQEIDKAQLKRQRAMEQSQAQSVDDLVVLGQARGYKNPHGWAAYVYAARKSKEQSRRRA